MAKKKNIVINDEELVPTVLAIKEDKKKVSIFGVLWIMVIFGIFIAGVIFLPDISLYVSNYLNPEPPVSKPSIPNKDNDDESVEKPTEIVEHEINDSLVIKEENFILKNIKIENTKISLDIENTSNNILEMDKYQYFINLYSGSKTLAQRIILDEGLISPGSTSTFTYDLKNSSVSLISLVIIKPEEYPSHIITPNENNSATLICTKGYETISYLLNNNKVYAIQDIFVVPTTDSNFATLQSTYGALSATYNTIGGVSSNIAVENDNLYFRTMINLGAFVDNSMNKRGVYPKDTDAKVMKFELEASGYSCN